MMYETRCSKLDLGASVADSTHGGYDCPRERIKSQARSICSKNLMRAK